MRSDKHEGQFKPGNPGGPGRPRGSTNRLKADLAQMIMNAAAEAGFLKVAKSGMRTATGKDGVQGFLRWLCVNDPRTMAGLLARILPYYVNVSEVPGKGILTYEETVAQLRERGLPPELIDQPATVVRRAAVRSGTGAARASRMTANAVRPARRPVATTEQRSA
jgi:hypothetical protein